MDTKSEAAVLDRILDPVSRCLSPEVARQIVKLRADPKVQRRVEDLARKNTAGQLTAEERAEYETYVAAGTFVAILQSKARALLKRRSSS
ncbi:MAG: hypothetical protein HY721_00500 [Planctomycetes bacterium]|nr:hypothetical protein [Planctomycetota bacterium]